MKTYKSPNNDLYAYELDGSQDHLIPANFVKITDTEADAIRLAKMPTKEEQIAKLQAQLDELKV